MLSRVIRAGGFAVLFASLATSAFAQGAGGVQIRGTAYDQDKAVLPGVVVTVTNDATAISRDTTTSGDGQFTMTSLAPGTYSIVAELQGFQRYEQRGMIFRVGQEVTLNLTLQVATVSETVTVTAGAPLVEPTASRIGTVVTDQDIDSLPSQGRNQLSLIQLVPGVTPSLSDLNSGEFEGDTFAANGQVAARNQWNVDGAPNQQTNGGGSGPQARITLDSTAEFQVLTHQYTAETGGATGVIVNAVTKSGTNTLFGRGFYYFTNEKLTARNSFLPEDQDKPESGQNVYGFNVGGPIIKNRAFFFFNLERVIQESSVVHNMPDEAAPLVTSYAAQQVVHRLATFLRGDYTQGNHNLRFTWAKEPKPAVGNNLSCCETLDQREIELSFGDRAYTFGWTAILGNRATNEVTFSRVGERRLLANLAYSNVPVSDYFKDGWLDDLKYIGLNGRDQFDIGSLNSYSDFSAGLDATNNGRINTLNNLKEVFTYATNQHTVKAGVGYIHQQEWPRKIGNNDNGTFTFQGNVPFNPGNAFTYPSEFAIVLGDIDVFTKDEWWNWFAQDQWKLNNKLTLNMGLRWDYQDNPAKQKDAFSPRLGFAYDPLGDGKTVIRGGVGKFYDYQLLAVKGDLNRLGVFSQTFTFATDEDLSAVDGVIPTSHECLQPILSADGRLAAISPACRAFLTDLRNSLQPGAGAEFVNIEPRVDREDRRMGYLWGYSLGVQHQLMNNLAIGVDYIGNRGRDQTRQIDINEGPAGANGRITRLGADGFDPDGVLIPESARDAEFLRVLQYQISDAFNSDFDSMEVSVEKRFADRWSARAAYTLAYSNDVPARASDDLNPRQDYARSDSDNRHAFVTSLSVNPWRGLTAGAVFRAYAGYPINETIGRDVNGDRDNLERPVAGIHDLERPILSPLDGNGRAIRNGIDGNGTKLLDLSFQYVARLPHRQNIGVFWEIYNALNTVNLANPTGNRNNDNYMISVVSGRARQMQLGVRYTF